MTSGFTAASATGSIWTRNWIAEQLERQWLRLLRTSGAADTTPGSDVAAFLQSKIETSGPGMNGFDIVEDPPFDGVGPRRLLARVVGELAFETMRALRQEPVDPSLAFLGKVEPLDRAHCVDVQERIHELLRGALDDPPPRLALDVEPTMRAAIAVINLGGEVNRLGWGRKHREATADPHRELALRRSLRDAQSLAHGFVTPESRRASLYELADLEESLELFGDSAATTRQGAQLEQDPEGAALAEAIAAEREARR